MKAMLARFIDDATDNVLLEPYPIFLPGAAGEGTPWAMTGFHKDSVFPVHEFLSDGKICRVETLNGEYTAKCLLAVTAVEGQCKIVHLQRQDY